MTIERAPGTDGRVHTNGAKPLETAERQPEKTSESAFGKVLMPLVLMAVAVFVLRRLNKGNVV
jgi:hypothetical protein